MKEKMFSFSKDITAKQVYDSLSQNEQRKIKQFKDYLLISASAKRTDEAEREIIRFRKVIGKDLFKVDLEDLRYFLKELKEFDFADYTKNKMKDWVKRFLRWSYKDWSVRFDEFRDIKNNGDAQRRKPITSKEIIKKTELERLMKAETSLYWKAFLITQYEGGLRTGETRTLTWDRIDFEDDDFTALKIPCKKNKNSTIKIRTIPLKEATYYLKELKEEQRIKGVVSKYVFPSPFDVNKPISKSVNLWFSKLTKKVLGRACNNYLLRHSRGTELKRLIKEGGMSKDNATEFMGHSEKMFDKVYSHMDKEDVKEMLKKQIYNFEYIPEEKKHELEKEVEILRIAMKKMQQISIIQNDSFMRAFSQMHGITPAQKKTVSELQARFEKLSKN